MLFVPVFTTCEVFCQENTQSSFLAINNVNIDASKIDDTIVIPSTYENIAKGRTTNISANHYLWLVVHPEGSFGYWPQLASILPHPRTKKWTTKFWLGRRGKDIGKIFELWLVLVDEDGNDLYLNHLLNGQNTGKYPEIPLPRGSQTVDMLTVTKSSN